MFYSVTMLHCLDTCFLLEHLSTTTTVHCNAVSLTSCTGNAFLRWPPSVRPLIVTCTEEAEEVTTNAFFYFCVLIQLEAITVAFGFRDLLVWPSNWWVLQLYLPTGTDGRQDSLAPPQAHRWPLSKRGGGGGDVLPLPEKSGPESTDKQWFTCPAALCPEAPPAILVRV